MPKIMQGDQYSIPFVIKTADGELVNDSAVKTVEFMVGWLRKTYPEEVTYADGKWRFPLTQEETFKLAQSPQRVQARLLFVSGEVVGVNCGSIDIEYSQSKEVLQ